MDSRILSKIEPARCDCGEWILDPRKRNRCDKHLSYLPGKGALLGAKRREDVAKNVKSFRELRPARARQQQRKAELRRQIKNGTLLPILVEGKQNGVHIGWWMLRARTYKTLEISAARIRDLRGFAWPVLGPESLEQDINGLLRAYDRFKEYVNVDGNRGSPSYRLTMDGFVEIPCEEYVAWWTSLRYGHYENFDETIKLRPWLLHPWIHTWIHAGYESLEPWDSVSIFPPKFLPLPFCSPGEQNKIADPTPADRLHSALGNAYSDYLRSKNMPRNIRRRRPPGAWEFCPAKSEADLGFLAKMMPGQIKEKDATSE